MLKNVILPIQQIVKILRGRFTAPMLLFFILGLTAIRSVGYADNLAPQVVSSPVEVTQLYISHNATNPYNWSTCLSFVNETKQTVQAVKFRFVLMDAFDTRIDTIDADRVGDFAPNVPIEGPDQGTGAAGDAAHLADGNCWTFVEHVPSLSTVQVQIAKVRFMDGSIWSNPSPTAVRIATYLSDADRYPKKIKCHGFGLSIWYNWDYAHQVPICQRAISDWEKQHPAGVIPSPSSTPDPSPSPGTTASPTPW